MRILCIGDSNTWGYDPENQTRYKWRWTKILDNLIEDEVIEEGLCGRTCIAVDQMNFEKCGFYSLKEILKHYPAIDCVIVMLGTNDFKTSFHFRAENVSEGYRQYIQYIKAHYHCHILMISPITFGQGIIERNDGLCAEFNAMSYNESLKLAPLIYHVCMEENVCFLDASKVAVASLYDDIHMNQQGHYLLAKTIAVQLAKMKEHQ